MKQVGQSFTLVEILVVIVIIGILSSFIFFTINNSVDKASIAKSKMFSESIRNNLLLNLVSEWKLDGDATDSWGSNNGTMNNFPASPWKTEAECVSGTCLEFDGVDDSITHLNINFTEDSAWTSIHWLNWQDFGINPEYVFYMGVPGTSNGLVLREGSNNRFAIRNSDAAYYYFESNSSNPYFQTGWFQLVWVADGDGNLSLYINAELLNTISATTSMVFSNIGMGYSSSGGYRFNGLMDEVQIYNEVISESQIKGNYLLGLNGLLASGNISEIEYNESINKLSEN